MTFCKRERAKTDRMAVLDYITKKEVEGATDEEIQVALNLSPNTERPRRIELVAQGLVEKSGITRFTSSHRKAAVWVATGKNYSRGFHKEPRPRKKQVIAAGFEIDGLTRGLDGRSRAIPETEQVIFWLKRGCP
jgi:hypothetical protein